MKKTNVIVCVFSLFLFLFTIEALAENVGNPFTAKGADEFTQEDRKKLEEEINKKMEKKLSNLESKLGREIESVKRASERSGNSGGFSRERPSMSGGDFDNNRDIFSRDASMGNKAVLGSFFVGCIDEKPMFRNNKTKEQFFATENEAKGNEEFNKMGSCSF